MKGKEGGLPVTTTDIRENERKEYSLLFTQRGKNICKQVERAMSLKVRLRKVRAQE